MAKPSWISVIKSVIAAGFGVQSDKNRKRDFEEGALPQYLVVGAVATFLFILALILVVSLVIGWAAVFNEKARRIPGLILFMSLFFWGFKTVFYACKDADETIEQSGKCEFLFQHDHLSNNSDDKKWDNEW